MSDPRKIWVSSVDDLATVHVAPLQSGSSAWVDDKGSDFVLLKSSALVPNNQNIVQPLSGSPRAGAPDAKWVQTDAPVQTGLVFYIQPNGTTDQLAELQAIIDTASAEWSADPQRRQRRIEIGPGTLRISAAVRVTDGVCLDGAGRDATLLQLLYSGTGVPLVGGVLDPTNCGISIRGTLNTSKMNTTPTSVATGQQYVPTGSPAVSVANKGTIAAGDYFVYGGRNDPVFGGYQQNQMGPLLDWREMLQVDSVFDGVLPAATLRLKGHTLLHHTLTNGGAGVAITCKAVTPVASVTIRNLSIRNPGGTVAVGIFCEYALDVTIENVGFEGFTLAPWFGRVTQRLNVINPHSFGENNSFFWSDSCHQATAWNPTTNPNGKREHAQGRVFGMFTLYNSSAEWTVFGGSIEHVDLAFQIWGALNFKMIGTRIRDTDIDVLLNRDQTTYAVGDTGLLDSGSFSHAPQMGTGVDIGSVALSINQFVTGMQLIGVTMEDCRAGTASAANDESCTLWWHDVINCNFVGVDVLNSGRDSTGTIDGSVKAMNGIRAQDCQGLMTSCQVVGCEWAFRHNSSQRIEVRALRIKGPPGAGANPSIGWATSGNTASGSCFQDVSVEGQIHFEAGWNGADQDTLVCDRWNIDGIYWPGRLYPTYNLTGGTRASGDVVALDAASVEKRQTTAAFPANAEPAWAIMVDDAFGTANNAWGFSSRSPGRVNTAAGVSHGQALQAQGGSHKVEVTAAPTVRSFIGVVESYHAAAAAALVTR